MRMALLLTLLGAASSGYSIFFLGQHFDRSDANSYAEEAERVRVAFALERLAMSTTILDYARWDDTERFVRGKAPGYVEDNFSSESLRALSFSAFAFATMDGRIIESRMLVAKGQLATTPAEVREHLRPVIAQAVQSGNFDPTVSMIWVDRQAFLVSAAPVTDTQQKRKPSGYMFFLRRLDRVYLDRLRSITSSHFSLIEAPENHLPQTVVRSYRQGGQERWEARLPLAGCPAAVVVEGGTRFAAERTASYTVPVLNTVFMGFAALCGVYFILHSRVLSRLKQFSRLSDRYQSEGDLQIRWPVSGRDELDRLANSLNELVAKVESQRNDLEHLVEHDYLTGIGNRVLLLNRLAAMQNHARRTRHGSGSLLLIDLDGFKEINDRLGHAAGDKVLKVVSRRLQEPVRDYDTVARLGGDEFAVLLQDLDPQDADPYAQRILKVIEQPIEVDGRPVRVGCSGGIAPVTAQSNPDEVLRNADLAMYEAKRLGKARFVQFDLALLESEQKRSRPPFGDARSGDFVDTDAPSRSTPGHALATAPAG